MSMISVQVDQKQMAEITHALRDIKNGANKALAGAINDTMKTAKVRIAKEITEKVNLKSRDVKKYIEVKKRASWSNPTGRLSVQSSKRIGLHAFGARQVKGGIKYKILKGGEDKFLPGAFGFPKKKKNNFNWVAIRVGKERKPIRFPQGPNAWGVFLKAGIHDSAIKYGQKELHDNLDRRVRLLVGIANGTIAKVGRRKALIDK